MTPLTYCCFPVALNHYGITSAYEIQILTWAAMLPEGLKQSNNQLAELLQTDRRTVINSINRLKRKRLIEIKNPKYPRILIASGEIVSLLNSENVSLPDSEKDPQTGESFSQTGEKPDTHNKSKRRRKKNTRSIDDLKAVFDSARKLYPGRKNGLDVEFGDFKKSVKDWRDVLPILEKSIQAYATHCNHLKQSGQFCPHHKDFCRWLKNRCWETEYPDPLAGVTREADESEIDDLLGDVA